MATISLYFDQRRPEPTGRCQVLVAIRHASETAFLRTGVSCAPEDWNGSNIVGDRLAPTLNAAIFKAQEVADDSARMLVAMPGGKRVTAVRIRDHAWSVLHPEDAMRGAPFIKHLEEFIKVGKAKRTHDMYLVTGGHLRRWLGRVKADKLTFHDITAAWLKDYEAWMTSEDMSVNTRGIDFRNIRAVFNDAITREVTDAPYPFRRFRVRQGVPRKRALSVGALRAIINAKGLPANAEVARDLFVLSFMLCGINVHDLCALDKISDGRVDYQRLKTGKPYSIKVEPEALAIIDRHRGKYSLLDFVDGSASYLAFYQKLCKWMRSLRWWLEDNAGLPLDELTTYWARHSWATIAASLDIPKETIAAALGHGRQSVTDIYIDFDMTKVDSANRRVLDWVLYKKK